MSTRAQGTIEYLVIIAIIVVISLIVVALMLGFLDQGSSINATQSQIYWSSQEIGVVDSAVSPTGTGVFVIKNNSSEIINVTSLVIDSVEKNIASQNQINLSMGSINDYTISGIAACTGNNRTYQLQIKYAHTATGLEKSTSTSNIIVNCIPSISSATAAFILTGTAYTGAIPLSDGSGNWEASGTNENGIIISPDQNMLCLGGTNCDANISWDGNNLIIIGK